MHEWHRRRRKKERVCVICGVCRNNKNMANFYHYYVARLFYMIRTFMGVATSARGLNWFTPTSPLLWPFYIKTQCRAVRWMLMRRRRRATSLWDEPTIRDRTCNITKCKGVALYCFHWVKIKKKIQVDNKFIFGGQKTQSIASRRDRHFALLERREADGILRLKPHT